MAKRSLFLLASAASLALAAGMSTELQSVLKNTHRGEEYGYPTDFTRGILPVRSLYPGLGRSFEMTSATGFMHEVAE